jgi:pimeloyl-ACP methyl ester carboxylesterase
MKKLTVVLASLMALTPVALYTGSASDRTAAREACQALTDLRIDDTKVLSAAMVPAAGDLPEYCRVLGIVQPAINFEIRLPAANWNGKFYMAGCGGFCGQLGSDSDFILDIKRALRREYAVSMTDGGHRAENMFDTRWGYHNRSAEIDYGHRAVHETARATKAIIEAFYHKAPAQSYFGGCSNGGRQGVMEALRYPEDFDGIISDAPGLDLTGMWLNFAWIARANTGPDGKNLITAADASLIGKAVYQACDRLDGLEDGLISDPRACRFDPSTLACTGEKSANCLSAVQVNALKALYQGPRNSAGRQLNPGLPLGSEPYWGLWHTGQTSEASDDLFPRLGEGALRYLGFDDDPGERYTVADLDFDRDPPRLEFMGKTYNATDPNLDAFRRRGGKLLMWHGWADPAVSPTKSIEYYDAVERRVGRREETQAFFRLFMAPGTDHCGTQDGPGIGYAGYDPLTALEKWVEHKEAPASLLMTKTDSAGKVLWTRPACPYPQRAVYRGRGDRNVASSFRCTVR